MSHYEELTLELMFKNKVTIPENKLKRLNALKNGTFIKTFDFYNENTDKKIFLYDYRMSKLSSTDIVSYFNQMVRENNIFINNYVIDEWSKTITTSISNWNIYEVKNNIEKKFDESYGDAVRVEILQSKPAGDEFSQPMDTLVIRTCSNNSSINFHGIAVLVLGEQLRKNSIMLEIFTVVENIYDTKVDVKQVNNCVNKILSVKENQNPRLNNYLQSIKAEVIDQLEAWFNCQNTNNIY